MARGITSEEVNRAADALLAGGERPTAERVRLALGRGSPNTIGPMLETWWGGLAQRLRTQLALPGVPEDLGAAFVQVWAQALAAGQAHAETLVAPERAALAASQAEAAASLAAQPAVVARLEAALQQADTAAHGAQAALTISEQRAADLQREVATLIATAETLSQQRVDSEQRLITALAQADEARSAAAREREALQALLHQVEDRAYGEVDRTRQELKVMKAKLTEQARIHARELRTRDQACRTAESALHKSQRALATALARGAAKGPAALTSKVATPRVRPRGMHTA